MSEQQTSAPAADGQPMQCGVCSGALALAAPRYVHADGKTYRHPIRPVPAGGDVVVIDGGPNPRRTDSRDAATMDEFARVVTDRFGPLPVVLLHDLARRALDSAKAAYALHGDIEPPATDETVSRG